MKGVFDMIGKHQEKSSQRLGLDLEMSAVVVMRSENGRLEKNMRTYIPR